MAERHQEDLQKEATCSICLDLFKEPKKLPCDHVYCKECLKGLVLHSNGENFTCPMCRTDTQVPNSDINNFPAAVFEDCRSSEIKGTLADAGVKVLVGHQTTLIIELTDISTVGKTCQVEMSQIEAELVWAPQGGSRIKGRVDSSSPDQVEVTFTPQRRGQYKLIVRVDGAHVINSPFMMIARMPLEQMTKPVCTLITELEHPTSLVYSQGKVLVTETMGNKVLEIDAAAQELQHGFRGNALSESVHVSRQQLRVQGANGLTQDSDHNLYVSTPHQLHKFTRDGRLIGRVGCCGTGCAEFMHPSGLRISQQNELHVCDSNNHRIQVFDLGLNFKRSFGTQGTGNVQFRYPNNIDFDSSGQIYITDTMNNRILIFASDECHLCTIKHQNFCSPMGLLIYDDHIYTTDYRNHRVLVMKLSGDIVTTFGNEYLKFPEGITVDEDGFLYITSDHSKIIAF